MPKRLRVVFSAVLLTSGCGDEVERVDQAVTVMVVDEGIDPALGALQGKAVAVYQMQHKVTPIY